MRQAIQRCCIMLAVLLAAPAAFAATGLKPGALNEFTVELPMELRKLAGRGQVSPVNPRAGRHRGSREHRHGPRVAGAGRQRDVRSAIPFEPRVDGRLHGNRARRRLDHGGRRPHRRGDREQDDVPLRLALVKAALATLAIAMAGLRQSAPRLRRLLGRREVFRLARRRLRERGAQRSSASTWPASTRTRWLPPPRQFHVLDAKFRNVPVFLQSGETDEVATPEDHRAIYDELKRAGFRRVRLEYCSGAHEVDPGPLRAALDGFRATSTRIRPRHSRPCAGALPDIAAP